MPGTIANGQFDTRADNPTGKIINATTGYTLGSTQAHHLARPMAGKQHFKSTTSFLLRLQNGLN
jgi:hypothetical protein